MGETLLQKEFKEKDIQRLRNIISKKYGDAIGVQIGYDKKEQDHKEGDIWVNNEKTWTIKDGITQSYTKLDAIKAEVRIPLCCPNCDHRMKGKLDTKMFQLHGKCLNCTQEMESQLKLDGKYDEYAQSFTKNNAITFVEEARDFIKDFLNESTQSYVTQDGDIEDWDGKIDTQLADKWIAELDELEEQLKS